MPRRPAAPDFCSVCATKHQDPAPLRDSEKPGRLDIPAAREAVLRSRLEIEAEISAAA